MRFFSTILTGATCVVVALAQLIPNIAFTSVPAVVIGGSSYNITWGGGEGFSPVTITLRKGDPMNLLTIDTLTSSASDGLYIWTVSKSLSTADDYALQITQGQFRINYSGELTIIGAPGLASFSYSGTATMSLISSSFMNKTTSTVMNTTLTTMPVNHTTPGRITMTAMDSTGKIPAATATVTTTTATFLPTTSTAHANIASVAQPHGSIVLLFAGIIAILSLS